MKTSMKTQGIQGFGKCLWAVVLAVGCAISVSAGPLDDAVLHGETDKARAIDYAWCCDMGGRKTLKRNAPGISVDETAALRYFDPVNMAKRVSSRCRVEITRAGLGDYICPPSGIAVLYNNLKCPKKIDWVQGSTHGYVPSEKHQHFSVAENWK